MPRVRYRDSYRTWSCPSSCIKSLSRHVAIAVVLLAGAHQLDPPVELPEHGRVVVFPEFEEFNRVGKSEEVRRRRTLRNKCGRDKRNFEMSALIL